MRMATNNDVKANLAPEAQSVHMEKIEAGGDANVLGKSYV